VSVPSDSRVVGDGDRQAAFAATLVDEWVRAGVRHAVLCPGSRSTPLALAVAAEPSLTSSVRLDERSAGFTALGIGVATGRPAVVVVTSGTATAELHASVVEADLARIPMLVCTADRPPELRDVGAPQTIDQHRLFGSAPRWYADPGVPDEGSRWSWRSLGSRAVAEAVAGPAGPGPVHLNLPFREPLVGDAAVGGVPEGRDDGGPWHRVDTAHPAPAPGLVEELVTSGGFVPGTRGLIVAGAGCGDPDAVLALAEALWWPVLADPRSGLRNRTAGVVAAADGILRSTGFAATHRPDVVLRLGGRWASKVVTTFLADLPSVVVEPYGWTDPERGADRVVRCDPTAFCRAITDAVATPGGGRSDRDAPWPSEWEARQGRADQVMWTELHWFRAGAEPALTEPALAHRLFQGVPTGGTLVVSSSMPVRDVEAFGSPRLDPPRVLANRGANGIDGVVSTALGVAVATGPTVAFVGDLAFLHDVSALVGPAGDRPELTVVVADNGGGGIFSFLPQADQLPADRFERLFGTPQSADPAAVARGFGWDVIEIDGAGWSAALDAALAPVEGGRVVVVRLPDRAANVAAHDRVNAAIVAAVDSAGGTRPVPTA
jgi:2-succinyl-5-enolpyruvyl-6-hydroxy-3-cyclohexene-1-carboxylate synthase